MHNDGMHHRRKHHHEMEVNIMGTIVLGYVAKPQGEAALAWAITEAKLRDLKIVAVNSHKGGQSYDADTAREQDELTEDLRTRLAASGVEFDVHQFVRGNEPVEDVVEIAERHNAELIVIGLRRRTAVGKFVLGSNAQRILMDAPCPVVAVKADA
jgi:nucleotide-binding universal stress UspA family protein